MNFPKTAGQCKYMLALRSNKPIIIGTGPAGTGKTMLACNIATEHILKYPRARVVLTRPIVAADEDMGYLPGDMDQKMEPWTRPMYDIFEQSMTHAQMDRCISIEPLGYMRGRTFENTLIIADEMQNSTPNQMKMLLTRIGEGSKMVITGDPKQHDRKYEDNGLIDICSKIDGKRTKRIEYIKFEFSDIERSPIVRDILEIYGDN